MNEQERMKVLKSSILFKGLPAAELFAAAKASQEAVFRSGEKLFSNEERRLGVIALGSARAVKPGKAGPVTMSRLSYGDVFGAVTVMNGELPPTSAIAVRQVTAVVFTPEAFEELLKNSFALTKNYCAYLISRIRFLTDRVECMAGGSASEKLLRYLETNAKNGVFHVSFGMDTLARAISMSRATLYRSLSDLEKYGKIARSGHEIRLL